MTKTLIAAALVLLGATPQNAKPFLGTWNITGTGNAANVVYWLDVKEEGGVLKGRFLNRASSPYDLSIIKVEGDELVFHVRAETTPQLRAKVVDGKLVGRTISRRQDGTENVIEWVGVRPPAWPASTNANASHHYMAPVVLFDGKNMDAWGVQHQQRGNNWTVENGVMMSPEKEGNNLVSKQTFKDFKLEAEYAIAPGSNGGIYLRGRYEMQLLDDFGKDTNAQGHMAIYGRTPPAVHASKPAGEWQTVEIIVVGNRVTATLNGKKVHDNAIIEGVTGGTLDANETAPGPIMLQGDHGKVMFRKVVVTPIMAH